MLKKIQASADTLSANAFLNAYLREFGDWVWAEGIQNRIGISHRNETVWITVSHRSQCGRHQFQMPALLEQNVIGEHKIIEDHVPPTGCPISFMELSAWLVDKAVEQMDESLKDTAAKQRFLQRIEESHDNICRVLIARAHELEDLFQAPLSFKASEQALLTGHSVHPAPKVRQPMSFEEAMVYGPEGNDGFALIWLWVRRERLHYKSADDMTLTQRIEQLVQEDTELLNQGWSATEEFELLPVHPWQWHRIRSLPTLQRAINRQDIIELGEVGQLWHATSSMRSLYAERMPYMLKFSMSVRLTNSIRHLQTAEAERGSLICQVLDSPAGQAFTRQFPQFTVMREPAYVCLKAEDGTLMPESMMVFRDNPIAFSPHSNSVQDLELLASLTQDHPSGGKCRLSRIVIDVSNRQSIALAEAAARWFSAYLNVVVKPLILAQADYGILMGAHQQNLVLKLKNGLPEHSFFRDCQGTGFSEVGVHRFDLGNTILGSSAENQIQKDMGNTLFAYYLIINSTFSVISALGADGIVNETLLLRQLRDFLVTLCTDERNDTSFFDYLLNAESLWQKGNFLCSLSDLNENTLKNPLAIYQPIANPIARLKVENGIIAAVEPHRHI